MSVPISSPTELHGIGACTITEVTPEQADAMDGFVYHSNLSGATYVIQPVSAIVTPLVAVNAAHRSLLCEKCQKVTTHTFVRDWHGKKYVCECGNEITYLTVGKTK